jgi:hypothetical protein
MKYARITFETAGGKRIDIVKDSTSAVSGSYIFYQDLERIIERVNELGVKLIGSKTLSVLKTENLLHSRTDL